MSLQQACGESQAESKWNGRNGIAQPVEWVSSVVPEMVSDGRTLDAANSGRNLDAANSGRRLI